MPGGGESRSLPSELPEPGGSPPEGRARVEAAAEIAAVAQSDAFRRLVSRRRRFTLLASASFYAAFAAFVGLAAWGRDWMATRIAGGLTVGYLLALAVVAAVWGVVVAYSRASVHEFDPLAAQAQADRRS
jgi:uncharacterized membrane protein (DUF485 family)